MFNHSIKKGLDAMSGLTKMHFALYDDKRHLIASSAKQDDLLAVVRSDSSVQAHYMDFIADQLKLALARHEHYFVQGITGQYHAFIPLHCGGRVVIVLAEGFYMTASDFKRFYCGDQARSLGVTERTEAEWLKDIRIYSTGEINSVLENVGSALQALITSKYNNDKLKKYSQQSKTIISIMSDMNSDYSVYSIYRIVIDTVIFLFETDTAAILVKKKDQYLPEITEGRNKHLIKNLRFSENNRLVTQIAVSETSVLKMNGHELLHAGFPDDITRMIMFPLTSDTGMLGILAIFNSSLDDDTCAVITDLCRLTAYHCGIRAKKEEFEAASERLDMMPKRASSLYSLYQDRPLLYEAIVNEASSLAGAEKCSLMMSDDQGTLAVRAACGINKRLMENVRVQRGEGISGKVYEQGLPVLIMNESDLNRYGNAPRSHYKTFSSLSLPLKMADETMGVLNLSDKQSGLSFAQSDISMLSPFLLQASVLLKLGSCHDALQEMTKLSMTDSLTGLFNRRYFDMRFEEEFLRAKRYSLILSLVVIDIDDFKPINDSEGHPAGDSILKEVSYIMSSSLRSHDVLTRFGGEEFAIIMPQTPKPEAFRVSERIRENIKRNIKPVWKEYHKRELTISSGIATYPECCSTKEGMIRRADKALYKAKNLGKDRTVFWE